MRQPHISALIFRNISILLVVVFVLEVIVVYVAYRLIKSFMVALGRMDTGCDIGVLLD